MVAWSKKRKADLVADLRIFLNDLCVQWGFCTRLKAENLVGDGQMLEADAFAVAILEAEGLDPATSEWRERIRKKFVERYELSVSMQDHAARRVRIDG